MGSTLVVAVLSAFIALKAGASEIGSSRSCLPLTASLQTVWNLSPEATGQRVWVLAPTEHVQVVGERRGGDQVHLKVRFDPAFEGVSLAYNLYAVLVVRNGVVAGWWDFTGGCEGPGVGFFPGREILLPVIKLKGDREDRLQIMVWGKL